MNTGRYIFTLLYTGSQVKSHSHDTVFVPSQVLAIQVEFPALTDAFKFHKEFPAVYFLQVEVFAIPDNGICVLLDGKSERFVLVESAR